MSVTFEIQGGREYARTSGLTTQEKFYDEVFEIFPFELNVANANARNLLASLNLPSDDLCGTCGAGELLSRLNRVGDRAPDFTRPEEEFRGTLGVHVISCSLSEDQLNRYYVELRAIAEEAQRREERIQWA